MDDETKKALIIIGAVFAAIVVLYFVISPYQNCMRARDNPYWCALQTSW